VEVGTVLPLGHGVAVWLTRWERSLLVVGALREHSIYITAV
jgi:hypothetical protein